MYVCVVIVCVCAKHCTCANIASASISAFFPRREKAAWSKAIYAICTPHAKASIIRVHVCVCVACLHSTPSQSSVTHICRNFGAHNMYVIV